MSACLDTSAVIAWLRDEPGADAVASALARGRPCMSWINAGEVHYVVARQASRQVADTVLADIGADVDLLQATSARVMAAAIIKADHRMAFADCFAVAAAVERGQPLLTADPEIIGADIEGLRAVDIRCPAP